MPAVALLDMGRSNASACYRELGAELRKRREAAGLAGDDICRVTGWHRSKVSRVEMGQSEISVVDAIHYLAACKVFVHEAKDILDLCRDAERKLGYWLSPHGEWLEDTLSSLIYHEATADRSVSYEPNVVPGLLQTSRYARLLIEQSPGLPQEDIDAAVGLREERQQILHRPGAGRFTFLVHEQALRLQVGGKAIMHEQLLKVLLLAGLPHVSVRVLPAFAGARGIFGSSFRVFEYRDHSPLVYFSAAWNGVFIDDAEFVGDYRRLLRTIASVALDEAKSRAFIAELADALDRRSTRRDAGIYELEEEQF
ncbi:helix-turn-helix transcriptional regulator [Actinophytocola sp.]|uniref:helix-turn-helix domain-containing protein n=1 Tax=Actinophytocola sp. TaxID=1872138 RepID=UPI002ED4F221